MWIKGITRDALVDAMRQAGVQQPEKVLAKGRIGGAVITMISAGEKPANRPGYSATKLYNFQYTPGGNEPLALVEDPTVTTSAPVQAPVSPVCWAECATPAAVPAGSAAAAPSYPASPYYCGGCSPAWCGYPDCSAAGLRSGPSSPWPCGICTPADCPCAERLRAGPAAAHSGPADGP